MSLRSQIVDVLRGPVLQSLIFTCGPTTVGPAAYASIADRLSRGLIGVRRLEAETSVSALYSFTGTDVWRADTFYFGPSFELMGGTDYGLRGRALLIHEATHALQDLRARHLSLLDAEAAAYLAQAYYFRLNGGDFTRSSRELRLEQPLDEERRKRGDELLAALELVVNRFASGGSRRVTSDELALLSNKIAHHPAYHEHARTRRRFDGIGT